MAVRPVQPALEAGTPVLDRKQSWSAPAFSLNRAQRRLHERLWYRNDILKARQLGISTYVAMLMLDMSLFRSNFHCGIIDKSLPDAQQKLAKLHLPGTIWITCRPTPLRWMWPWPGWERESRACPAWKKGGMATPYVGAQPPGFLQWERCAGGD